jgi:uncharacterized protein with NAD-binding domain and iron-sulfur cluster
MNDRTRRELLRDGAAVAGAAAVYGSPLAGPAFGRARRRSRRRVAVLGGGVGGLTVAHELAELGFEVSVYERRAFGGKARSFGVPGTAAGGRMPLPGEHGARFIPGFYANLPDTLRRIPFPGNEDGTYGNVVVANQDSYARSGGREDLNLSFSPLDTRGWTLEQLRQSLVAGFELGGRMTPQEAAFFASRLMLFFASCEERRLGAWEGTSWWDFVAAERFSEDYRRLLVSSVTRFILGSKADEASARTLGLLWEAGMGTFMGRTGGAFDRVLNLPTNEAWIDPWLVHLRKLGVKLHRGATVERLELKRGRIASATVRRRGGRERVEADWYVLAVPVERARPLMNRAILRADPSLERLGRLETRWMNGLQFFLNEQVPVVHGHVLYVDSPWALSSISQAQFWPSRDFARDYGDGTVRDCISVDLCAFDEPGSVYGRPAWDLRPDQIARDCWEQMKAHLNDTGRETLRDPQLVSWSLDPALVWRRGATRPVNEEPLYISTPGTWADRPDAAVGVPNLFLAADYVKAAIDTASMEGANEAGRRAAAAVLDAAGSASSPPEIHGLYQLPEFEPLRTADAEAWRRGLPNPLEATGVLAGLG